MRRLLSLAVVAALSLAPACYYKIDPDGYLWACDDQYQWGDGRISNTCYNTNVHFELTVQ
jgi:hypothetical protein